MDTGELKVRLGQILAEEECDSAVDWQSIERQSNALLGELQMPIPLIVEEYLRGAGRRQQDMVFGHAQRGQLLLYLRSKSEPLL